MQVKRSLACGMDIGYKVLHPGEELPWHVHEKATLCVVFGGRIQEEDALRVWERGDGDLVFRPKSEPHRNRLNGAGVQILTLEMSDPAMEALRDLGVPKGDPVFLASSRAAHLARLAQAELDGDDPAAEIELIGLAYELLATVVRRAAAKPSRPPRWVTRVHDCLREEFRLTPKLEELAKRERISPYQLSRVFRRHYGQSIGEFLRGLRVQHAMGLLANSRTPLAEVALDSGFYDQSHLTNVFKQQTGFTPADFRRKSAVKSETVAGELGARL